MLKPSMIMIKGKMEELLKYLINSDIIQHILFNNFINMPLDFKRGNIFLTNNIFDSIKKSILRSGHTFS